MGKKKRQKYSLNQKIIYSIVIIGIITIGIFINKKKEEIKAKEIKSGNFKVYGMVERLKPHSLKGKNFASRKDVLYLYYEKNDTIFHLIDNLPNGQIEKFGINLNDCFEIIVSKSDKNIFEIDFAKKIDTIIDKNNFEHQVYQTDIHKSIIE